MDLGVAVDDNVCVGNKLLKTWQSFMWTERKVSGCQWVVVCVESHCEQWMNCRSKYRLGNASTVPRCSSPRGR